MSKRGAQIRVPLGILRRKVVELAESQPLADEVHDEALRARVGEHPLDLLLEHARIVQPIGRSGFEQLVVRNAAPEKEGEARCELEVGDPIDAGDRDVGRLALESIQKLGIDEQPRQRILDAAFEIAAFDAPDSIELEQAVELGATRCNRVPECARREPGENARRARRLVRARARPADEDRAAARRVAGARRVVRPVDHEPRDRAAERDLAEIELVDARAALGVDERGGDALRARGHS